MLKFEILRNKLCISIIFLPEVIFIIYSYLNPVQISILHIKTIHINISHQQTQLKKIVGIFMIASGLLYC